MIRPRSGSYLLCAVQNRIENTTFYLSGCSRAERDGMIRPDASGALALPIRIGLIEAYRTSPPVRLPPQVSRKHLASSGAAGAFPAVVLWRVVLSREKG